MKLKVYLFLLINIIMPAVILGVNAEQQTVDINKYRSNRIVNDNDYLWVASKLGLVHYEKATSACRLISNQGLSIDKNATILGIEKDKNGILWIGSKEHGVYATNGRSTIHYNAPDNKYGPITYCYAFAFDSENAPWAGGAKFYTDFTGEKIHLIPENQSAVGTENCVIMDMAFDSKGNLWMATDYGDYAQLICHKKGTDNATVVLSGSVATSLSIDRNDNIWFVSDDGIHCYVQDTNIDTIYKYKERPDIPWTTYTACDIDQDGNIWFVASHYLLKYDGNKFKYYNCYGFDKAQSIICDGTVIWVYGDNDEIYRFENDKFSLINIKDELNGMINSKSNNNDFNITLFDGGDIHITGSSEIFRVDVYNVAGVLISSDKFKGENSVTIHSATPRKHLMYLIKIRHAEGETLIKRTVR